jgi:hypothetical protein
MKPHVVLGAVLLLSSFGCAAPVEEENVASNVQALNWNPDFSVGVIAVKYVGAQMNQSDPQWTVPLSQNPGSVGSGATSAPFGMVDMTGPRIGLKFTGPGTLPTMATDFRVSITAWYNGATGFTCPCTTSTTPWASDGGGGAWPINWPASNPPGLQFADRYEVTVDVRPWPSGNPKSLVDFQLAVRQCTTQGDLRGCAKPQYTKLASQLLTDGTPSFSHTADWGEGPIQPATYVPIVYLIPTLQ